MIIKQPGNNKYILHWEMSTACNYRCEFCYQHKNKIKPVTDPLVILKNASLIKSLIDYNFDKKLKLRLIGGEPSIWDLEKILGILMSQNLMEISITTNLSKSVDYYINLHNKYPIVTFACSYHSGYLTDDVQRDIFIKKLNTLVKFIGKENVKARFVLTSENGELFDYINSRILVPLDPLAIQGETEYYSDASQLERMKLGNKMLEVDGVRMSRYELSKTLKSIKGFLCKSSRLKIRQDGELFIGNCENPTHVGKLGETLIKLDSFEKVCNYDKLCSLHAAYELSNES